MGMMSNIMIGFAATIIMMSLIIISFVLASIIGVSPVMYLMAMLALLTTGLICLLLYLLGEAVLD